MKHELRILIVDDSAEDAALIVRQIQREFSVSYERVETPEEMQAALENGGWQIVISDYVMPKFSGLAALKLLHDQGMDLPFIMVSGQMGEDAAVEAMRAGAHDYLLKDRLSRLTPAIKRELNDAVVRRERRMAEEALSATEARFHSLVEQSLVGIFMLQDDIFIYVNPKFGDIFDYEPQQLIDSRSLLELVAPEDQIKVMTRFLRPLMEGCDSLHFFLRGKRRDGTLIDLEVNGTRTWVNGSAAIIGTLLDITERKRAEAELSKLWRAVEQSPVSVVITDLFGRIEYVNPKSIEVSGYSEQELIGKNPSILKSGLTDPKVYEELWSTITSGREWHGELHNRKKNGELFWESGHISAIKNSEGQVTHFVGVKEDVTERKLAIEQLRQVQKMEAIGQLAGGIAHDFNNLLTVINGYSTLLVRSLDQGSQAHKEAEQILRAGERAADLTRQLLSFSRRQILEPRVLDINKQVKAVQKMLQRLIGEHIGLVTSLSEDAGFVRIDPGQLEQIVMNLIVNARDASEIGGVITVATTNFELDREFSHLHPGSLPGSYVRLSVADQGQGMSEEVKQRLFEPFFTTKEMGRGTGLGLATVYGIVKQSGGYIEVVSEPGQGACINVYLPRASEPLPAPTAHPAEEEIDSSHTVLIVEDEPGVLNLVVHTLRMRGFTVFAATDPEQGIALFEEHSQEIDMLLTDVVMPFMSGPALAEQLIARKRELKVLFMSGHADDRANLEKILEKGMQFLPKPFAGDALIRKVRETLKGGAAQTALEISGGSN